MPYLPGIRKIEGERGNLISSVIFITLICILPMLGIFRHSFAADYTPQWSQASPDSVIVDDYAGSQYGDSRAWYYTRIGTDRGAMGQENYEVSLGGGQANVTVQSGWGGVWISLLHRVTDTSADHDALDPAGLLGPYVRESYQPRITGVEIDLAQGSGKLKVELKNINNQTVSQKTFTMSGGAQTLRWDVAPTSKLKLLNWLVDGAGQATVTQVRFLLSNPDRPIAEAVFLYSYGHLSQCYDPSSGFVRERARWPANEYADVQALGMFALASAVASDLGHVEEATARGIVERIKQTITALPRMHGLLPHFVANGAIVDGTEWSSGSTVICLTSAILACQALGIATADLEQMLAGVDWNDLTGGGAHSVGHGYIQGGDRLSSSWDVFGSEAFLSAAAYSAATGAVKGPTTHSAPPTWDGSGFNDELAALFYPMSGSDVWGNDWSTYRNQAYQRQASFAFPERYTSGGLVGLSASEVPEPWTVASDKMYDSWGVGGYNRQVKDGSSVVGYPIIAPHYAAMVGAEHPEALERVFSYLMNQGRFTPLNNVESLGLDGQGGLHWNGLKGSWNLGLQALGAARAASGGNYLAYRALEQNAFLREGFNRLFVRAAAAGTPDQD